MKNNTLFNRITINNDKIRKLERSFKFKTKSFSEKYVSKVVFICLTKI